MALDAQTAANMAGSEVTVAERWLKLYRKIHNLFLRNDFVNKNDFETTLKQINLRVDTLEVNILTMLGQIESQVAGLAAHSSSHIHMVPQAPTGILPSSPSITAPVIGLAQFIKTPGATSTTIAVEARDAILQATGEPVIPQ
jgi:hypothetical protein